MDSENYPESVLARELNSLSLQERNKVLECIHGVDDVQKETPDMIEQKLSELQEELDRIEQEVLTNKTEIRPSLTKTTMYAYLAARRDSEDFVTNKKFRLMFLRADAFDAPLAAQRLLIYLEEKLDRFGPKTLTRNLTLKDLSPAASQILVTHGIQQLLPARDSAGRAIFLIQMNDKPGQLILDDPMAVSNVMFYMISVAAEDEETQKRGLVSLQVIAMMPKLEDLEIIRVNAKRGNVFKWAPLRIKANHIWVKTTISNPLIRIILSSWSKGLRMHMRMHVGSYTELRYHLMTFGIPSDCLPYSSDGEEFLLNAHNRWLGRRKVKERKLRNTIGTTSSSKTEPPFLGLDLPGCRDVCLGRGAACHQHVGNVYMRTLMSTLLEEYCVASGNERLDLNKLLVKRVREGGGRFLKKTSGGWYEEVTNESGIERSVGGSFRGMLLRVAATSTTTTTTTATANSSGCPFQIVCTNTNTSMDVAVENESSAPKRPRL